MVAFIVQGGILLIPILLLSLGAVFLIVERALFYWQQRVSDGESTDEVLKLLTHTPAQRLALALRRGRSPQARVIAAALERGRRLADPDQRRTLDHLVLTEIAALERHVPYLQNIANVSTLLGLLGTVVGMIAAFVGMRSTGSTDLTILSGGIAQALITTAAGLTVAIPSTLCHHLYVNHVQRTVARLNIAVSEMTAHFISTSDSQQRARSRARALVAPNGYTDTGTCPRGEGMSNDLQYYRSSLSAAAAVPLTPLIDVVFLVVIFFMVSATFAVQSTVPVQLPRAAAEPPDASAAFAITVDESGQVFTARSGRRSAGDARHPARRP